MNTLQLKILAACSGRTFDSLCEAYGATTMNFLKSSGYIAVLENGNVVKTELGIDLSKPMGNATNEKLGDDGYQLIVDAHQYKQDGQLLLS